MNAFFKRYGFAGVALIIFAAQTSFAATPANLVPWGDFSASDGLPKGWDTLSMGTAAKVSDEPAGPDGATVVRMEATEQTRSFIYSPTIEVSPGEAIQLFARVKAEHVPEGSGNVMLLADFDGLGITANQRLHKIGSPAAGNAGWQTLAGNAIAPPGASTMRVRLGFTYSSGTCWWDGVAVHAAAPVVVRADVAERRLSRDSGGLPLLILNRSGDTKAVSIDLSNGDQHRSLSVQLDGRPQQHVLVPLTGALKAGPFKADVALHARDGEKASDFQTTIELTVPPPMAMGPVSPTHWLVEDRSPSIAGQVDLAITNADLQTSQLSIRLTDAQGNTLLRQSIASPLHDRYNAFVLKPTTPLPLGHFSVVAELEQQGGQVLTARQPWTVIPRSAVAVTLNADGYLVHNGKAVFPLGLFNGGGKMVESAKAGFTLSHSYNDMRVYPGVEPDDVSAVRFLDTSQAAGMEAVTMVPLEFGFHGQWDLFRQRIRLLRNHPALLVWDEEEGIGRGDMDVAALAMMRKIITEEDPNHPLMVGDSRDAIQRVTDRSSFFPIEQMDLGMWWWYPVPAGIHPGSALGGDELTNRFELTPPDFLTRRNTDKPLWVGVQAYKKPGKLGRYATPVEQRYQAYVSIICGAKGLMWYAGSVNGGIFQNPEEGHWTELKALAGELREIQPVLMSPHAGAVKYAPAKLPISAIIKSTDNRTVLLAANRDVAPVDVEFDVPAGFTHASVFRENRQVTCTQGKLTDRFDGYAVHVYELKS